MPESTVERAPDATGSHEQTLTNGAARDGEYVRSLEEALRQRERERSLFSRFASVLGQPDLDLRRLLSAVEDVFAGELDFPGGAVFTYDPAKDELHLRHDWGLPRPLPAQFASLTLSDSPIEAALRSQQVTEGIEAQEMLSAWPAGPNGDRPLWRGLLCLPLLGRGELVGAACLFSENGEHEGDHLGRFYEIVASQLGTTLHNFQLADQLHASRERLRRLAWRIFSTQERERARVSHELHDEAGQALTALKFNLEMIVTDLTAGAGSAGTGQVATTVAVEDACRQLVSAINLCEATMAHIHLLAHDLRPAAIENLGLNTTLEAYCRSVDKRTPFAIDYFGAEIAELSQAVAIGFYRLLQEALINIAKHANATHVAVTLQGDARTVSLTVADDGQGFDARALLDGTGNSQGIGLSGMRERIESVGGRLVISSRPGRGTILLAWLPRTPGPDTHR